MMRNNNSVVSNDATLKIIGFEYQKLWAIKCCLEAEANSTIYIECLGDVCDGNVMLETKHHNSAGHLTPQSVDFWKTLKNLIIEYELLSECSRFILVTTQGMFANEGWNSWNKKAAEEKYKLVTGISPCNSIKKHYEVISTSNKAILHEILSKFEIQPNSGSIQNLTQLLLQHNALKMIPSDNYPYILKELIGYVTKCAIDSLDSGWQIDINTFIDELQRLSRIYNSEKIQFPREDKIILDESSFNNYTFIKELKDIEYAAKVEQATQNFFRANKSQIRLLKSFPNLAITLDNYDIDISDELVNIKTTKLDESKEQGITKDKRHYIAKRIYDGCMSISLKEINGVEGTEMYYQRGRMHSLVENDQFHWIIEEDEI